MSERSRLYTTFSPVMRTWNHVTAVCRWVLDNLHAFTPKMAYLTNRQENRLSFSKKVSSPLTDLELGHHFCFVVLSRQRRRSTHESEWCIPVSQRRLWREWRWQQWPISCPNVIQRVFVSSQRHVVGDTLGQRHSKHLAACTNSCCAFTAGTARTCSRQFTQSTVIITACTCCYAATQTSSTASQVFGKSSEFKGWPRNSYSTLRHR